uniref:Uncharacterized protein n=1 Tax=Phlebotomus papatasi TaxID=29031 RepID=A0A1B0DPL8_PHLPP
MGVSPQRLNLLVKYIKKEYSKTRKQLEAPGKGNQTNVHWKWYKYCHFLRELKNPPNYSKPAEISNANDSSGNASNRSSQSHQPEESEHIPIKDEEPDEDDDDDVGSVTKVYIVDTCPQMKPEDQEEDSRESIHHHSHPPGSTHSEDDHAPMDESDKERDSTENSRRQDKSNKEFLIKGVCSSVRYNLSNDKISEDEVIEFHGELLKYMHSYFKNKFK